MSLDVYLTLPGMEVLVEARIFIRENGQTIEISREEWDRRSPGREPFVVAPESGQEVYEGNITHNLNKMAQEAGVYKYLWRPDEIGVTHARQLIEPLEKGLETLKQDPDTFRKLNPPNGWGDYDGLVGFVEHYLKACKQYPDAEVSVSR